MSRQFWQESLAWSTADGTPVTANGTETIIFSNITIPANYMQDGRQLECYCWGKFSTTTGPPTLRLRVRWGGVAGTLLLDTGTITTIASVTNAIFRVYYRLTTRVNGSAGSLLGFGEAVLFGAVAATVGSATGAPAFAPMGSAGITAPAAVTCDLSVDTALSITAAWSSASNSLTGMSLYLDSPN